MLQNVFQCFFVTAEKPKLGLLVIALAGVTNMVLDYLFIAVVWHGDLSELPLQLSVANVSVALYH